MGFFFFFLDGDSNCVIKTEPSLKPVTPSMIHTSPIPPPGTAQYPASEKDRMTDVLLINHTTAAEKSLPVVTGRTVLVTQNNNSHFKVINVSYLMV